MSKQILPNYNQHDPALLSPLSQQQQLHLQQQPAHPYHVQPPPHQIQQQHQLPPPQINPNGALLDSPIQRPSPQQPHQPTKPTYAKRGRITIVACVPCRRRKTKCDGKRPSCSQCIARDGTCAYDMTDDQRKLTYLRDNVEQLQEKSSALESLLHTIQNANEDEASEVFRRLRSGTDVQMVADQVQAGRLLSGVRRVSEYGSSGDGESSRDPRHPLLQLNFQDDQIHPSLGGTDHHSVHPTISQEGASPSLESAFSMQDRTFGMVKGAEVKATHATTSHHSEFLISHVQKPWSTVVRDDDTLEHLVELYFTWQHSFFQSFPEHLFRKDMASGSTKYCSSMLINAICAAGCFLSHRPEVSVETEAGRTFASRLIDEAKKQYSDDQASNITSTAALYLISYVDGTRGELSGFWRYSGASSNMAIDLDLHLRSANRHIASPDTSIEELRNEEHARVQAFWGAFHVDQITSFTLGRLPAINFNGVTTELPLIIQEEDERPWEAAGLGIVRKPGARASVFHYCATLSRIVNSTLLMFFAPTSALTGESLLEEYQLYLDWKNDLPDIVAHTKNAPPHVICLHMYYHAAVLLLFRPFLRATISDSNIVPRDICRECANTISELWAEHRSVYNLSGVYMFQVHCLLTACTIHIVNLPSISATKHFTEACNTMQDLSSRNAWAGSCLTILRGLVQTWKLILPQQAEQALYRGQEAQDLASVSHPVVNYDEHPSLSKLTRPSEDRQQPADPALVYPGGPAQPQRYPNVPIGYASGQQSAHGEGGEREPIDGNENSEEFASLSSSTKRPHHSPGSSNDLRPSQRQRRHSPMQPPSQPPITSGQQSKPADFLYSPVASQAAPLLVPVARKRSDKAEEGSKSDEARSNGAGIEGMQFGNDWRDPFMGHGRGT